jgi:hypothetical protein
MRNVFLAAVAVGAVAAAGLATTPVRARDYPFCIKGADYTGPMGDCMFDTYQQCQASASGRLDYCDRNYFFDNSRNSNAANPRKPGRPHWNSSAIAW